MQTHYDRLGITPEADLADIKSAYRARLKEFPAHSHPQDFKEIRAAYEALRKSPQQTADFFEVTLPEAELDKTVLDELQQQAIAAVEVTLKDMILLTF